MGMGGVTISGQGQRVDYRSMAMGMREVNVVIDLMRV